MDELNYYDVLGIRPNAGKNEIELAYKGRRSQYHPDKYTQSDVETQAWATKKMQELNAAYAALLDPSSRRATHQEQSQRNRRYDDFNSQEANSSAGRECKQEAFTTFLDAHPQVWDSIRIFKAPNIPTKKLLGALDSYGHGIRAEDVVILVDDTVFGGARDGMLISKDELRIKELGSDAAYWTFNAIESISISKGHRLHINGMLIGRLQLADINSLTKTINALQSYLRRSKEGPEFSSSKSRQETGSTVLEDLEALHDQTLRALAPSANRALLDLLDQQVRKVRPYLADFEESFSAEGAPADEVRRATIEFALVGYLIAYSFSMAEALYLHYFKSASDFPKIFSPVLAYCEHFRSRYAEHFGHDISVDATTLRNMARRFGMANGEALGAGYWALGEALDLFESAGGDRETAQDILESLSGGNRVWFDQNNSALKDLMNN